MADAEGQFNNFRSNSNSTALLHADTVSTHIYSCLLRKIRKIKIDVKPNLTTKQNQTKPSWITLRKVHCR